MTTSIDGPGNSSDNGDLTAAQIRQAIDNARSGCTESLGLLAERCRSYLLLVANRELDDQVRGKLGASDIVQETVLAAQKIFGRFHGDNEAELRLWMRRILLHRVAERQRSFLGVAKRNVRHEAPLVDSSSQSGGRRLADPCPTPQAQAMANEQIAEVERAVRRLPPRQQEVIRLRCTERKSFAEIAELLGTSTEGARKVFTRAVDQLRSEWENESDSC